MRTRSLLSAAFTAAALLLTACGDAGTITKAGDPVANDSAGGSTGESGSDPGSGSDGTVPSEDMGTDEGGSTDTMPDLDGIMEDDCLLAGTAMASMASGLTGEALTAEQQEQIEAARDSLPEDVRADFDTVAAAFELMQTEGIIAAGEAMSSPEFEAAQQRIEAYLEKVCGGG